MGAQIREGGIANIERKMFASMLVNLFLHFGPLLQFAGSPRVGTKTYAYRLNVF